MGNKYIFNNTPQTKDNITTIVTVSETFNELTSSANHALPSSAVVEDLKESEQNFSQRIISWRGFIVLLMHAAYIIHGSTLSTASIAIVCMSGPVVSPDKNISSNTSSAFNISGLSNVTSFEDGLLLQEKKYEFSWDAQTRGFLLSAIFFTSFLGPIFANSLRGYFGNKVSMAVVTMVLAGSNFLSPVTARTNVYIFLAVRILSGSVIVFGMLLVLVNEIRTLISALRPQNSHMSIAGDTLAWWLPVTEKLTSVSFVMAGWYVAGFIGPLLSGYLCLIPFDGGWPLIFYFNGAIAVPWTFALIFLSSRKPEDHPFISDKEKAYIIRTRVGLSQDNTNTQAVDVPPYRSIFSSIPVLSFVVSCVAIYFNVNIFVACVPIYMAGLLRYSIQEVGIIMAVVWALRLPAALMWSAFGNWLLQFESINTNRTRKICFFLGQTLACVCSVGICFCGEQYKWVASALFLTCMASATFGTSMMGVVPLDMAPRYAGFITSLSMSVAFLFSLTGPIFVSNVTAKGSFEEWQLVWITTSIVFFASGLQFTIFGSSRLQPWAVPNMEITTVRVWPANSHVPQKDTEL